MDLQKRDVNSRKVIIIALWRVTNKNFYILIILFQPSLKCSTYEAAANNAYFDFICHNF